ncbi:MAG: ABC transporter ATP-binding protein [Bacteroidaceae bacterium]|nr:ABC transporter ATP-binding protein [Bacteroidaceae bacterium]
MLSVKDVSISFGKESVIRHFSCHISPAELICLTGKSGCGKSSLLRAFIGLTPFNGEICVQGIPVNERSCESIRRNTAYLPQDLSFPGELVSDIISQIKRLGRVVAGERAEQALIKNLALLGLEDDIVHKRMSEISGGQRQRIILAAIALLDKDLWLLDEPTSALDCASRNLVLHFLRIQQQEGRTIVAVTHDKEFAEQCSRVINLDT